MDHSRNPPGVGVFVFGGQTGLVCNRNHPPGPVVPGDRRKRQTAAADGAGLHAAGFGDGAVVIGADHAFEALPALIGDPVQSVVAVGCGQTPGVGGMLTVAAAPDGVGLRAVGAVFGFWAAPVVQHPDGPPDTLVSHAGVDVGFLLQGVAGFDFDNLEDAEKWWEDFEKDGNA